MKEANDGDWTGEEELYIKENINICQMQAFNPELFPR